MSDGLFYLALTVIFSGLLSFPYVLNRILVGGLGAALGYPSTPAALAVWADRLKKAHANNTENLVIFAAAVLSAHLAGLTAPLIGTAAMIYFLARVVYAIAYAFGVPVIRTLAFTAGLLSTLYIALQVVLAGL